MILQELTHHEQSPKSVSATDWILILFCRTIMPLNDEWIYYLTATSNGGDGTMNWHNICVPNQWSERPFTHLKSCGQIVVDEGKLVEQRGDLIE